MLYSESPENMFAATDRDRTSFYTIYILSGLLHNKI